MPTCLPAYLPTRTHLHPTCLHTYTYLRTDTYIIPYICLPTYLPTYLPASMLLGFPNLEVA